MTFTATNRNGSSASKVSQDAYSAIVEALSIDMPLIMHGSGDAREVNPETVRLLAELTADYISNLVEAAVDSQEILNDGQRPPLPPPPLVKNHRTPAKPAPWAPPSPNSAVKGAASKKATEAATNAASPAAKQLLQQQQLQPNQQPQRIRKRPNVEYWDEPLEEPKIKGRPVQKPPVPEYKMFQGVSIDEWTGVAGVDFFEQTRVRGTHVALPAAIGTQNFIFPVCHDQGLYGKILDVQTARRSIEPVLADPAIQDIIRKEGSLHGLGALRKHGREKKGNNGRGDEPEETEGEDHGATWPGLEDLLPTHSTKDFLGFLG